MKEDEILELKRWTADMHPPRAWAWAWFSMPKENGVGYKAADMITYFQMHKNDYLEFLMKHKLPRHGYDKYLKYTRKTVNK